MFSVQCSVFSHNARFIVLRGAIRLRPPLPFPLPPSPLIARGRTIGLGKSVDKKAIPISRGFTLLETLVALAIIGVSMAAAMRSTHFSIDVVSDLKKRTAASWVAQNQLNQLRAARQFPEPGAASGKAAQGDQTFTWRQEVSVTPNYSFRRVEIKVFTLDDDTHFVARQVAYVARHQN